MPLVRIKTKGQITIPKKVRDALGLAEGDLIDIEIQNGRGIILPKRVVTAGPVPRLSPKELRLLEGARKKIETINEDMLHSQGLTREEAAVSAKAGLIARDQVWFWLENWQRSIRAAEQGLHEGRLTTHDSPQAFLKVLGAVTK
jgi:AbrB family looped-hinge helix DNA binding protein